MIRCHVFIVIFAFLFACVQKPKPVFTPGYQPPDQSVTVMTYNVENLFDTEDDPNKKDEEFLPLVKKTEPIKAACRVANAGNNYRLGGCLTKDWSEKVLAQKMQRLTSVLRTIKNGKGPDILIMEEVENRQVLEQWRTQYLSEFNYKPALLIEGPDERGIDVGIFTRLEVVNPLNLHVIPFKTNENLKEDQIRPTRGILEANLKLPDGTPLTVLGVHFPSQAAPSETRKQALEFINQVKSKLPADRMVIVGGDFNISSDEEFKTGFMKKMMSKDWGVSHLLGCEKCDGTYFYTKNMSWSFFDIFLMSPNLLPEGNANWKVLSQSIRIENKSLYQINKYGGPSRFDQYRNDGVSDHWPLAFEIIKR